MSGAVVMLVDALGNSAFFEDTLTTFYTTLNNTDSYSTLTVGDSTRLAVNEVIKLEPYSELLRVSAIINATSVTVERGYLGTKKGDHRQIYLQPGAAEDRAVLSPMTTGWCNPARASSSGKFSPGRGGIQDRHGRQPGDPGMAGPDLRSPPTP